MVASGKNTRGSRRLSTTTWPTDLPAAAPALEYSRATGKQNSSK
jgi:hypothetical protein